jgi:hypothetical protein
MEQFDPDNYAGWIFICFHIYDAGSELGIEYSLRSADSSIISCAYLFRNLAFQLQDDIFKNKLMKTT